MTRHKIIVTFYKKGLMKYISHLDLARLFSRCLRKADLPIFLTKGFNPHPKISFPRALKLGVESDNERAVFWLDSFLEPAEFKHRINSVLPDGIKILDAYSESVEEASVCAKRY